MQCIILLELCYMMLMEKGKLTELCYIKLSVKNLTGFLVFLFIVVDITMGYTGIYVLLYSLC